MTELPACGRWLGFGLSPLMLVLADRGSFAQVRLNGIRPHAGAELIRFDRLRGSSSCSRSQASYGLVRSA